MTDMVAVNSTTGIIFADQVTFCSNFFLKLRGLLGRAGMRDNEVYYFPDCNSIHTFFMRFAIDIIFVNQDSRIVKIKKCVKPYRMVLGADGTTGTLELPCGALEKYRFKIGDEIQFRSQQKELGMTAMFSLRITRGPSEGEILFSKGDRMAIGSHFLDNDLIINHSSVAKRHAMISVESDAVYLINLQNEKDCYRNGMSIAEGQKVHLSVGDELIFGDIGVEIVLIYGDSGIEIAKSPDNGEKNRIENEPTDIGRRKIKTVKSDSFDNSENRKKALWILLAGMFGLMIWVACLATNSSFFNAPKNTVAAKIENKLIDHSKIPIPLPAQGIYGYMRNKDNTHPYRAVFTFKAETDNAELHYAIGGVDEIGEVIVKLNGEEIADAPLAKNAWGKEQTLPLPGNLLIEGEENTLVFDNAKNQTDMKPSSEPSVMDMWGVQNIFVKFQPKIQCNPEKANRLFDLAEKMYDEKTIAKGNLFAAHQYYTETLSYLSGCSDHSEMLDNIRQKKKSTEHELETKYNDLVFVFKKSVKVRDYVSSKNALENIIALVPDASDKRNKQAQKFLEKVDHILMLRKR